jgi:hypothetical protein
MLAVDLMTARGNNYDSLAASLSAFWANPGGNRREWFFENSAQVWGNWLAGQDHLQAADAFWEHLMGIAHATEVALKVDVHKGTPYYFWGETNLLMGNLDKGFLLMHQALEEDRENHPDFPDTPAYWLVLLDDRSPNQNFRDYVHRFAGELRSQLSNFRDNRAGTITETDFRTKFLWQTNLYDQAIAFTYGFVRASLMRHLPTEISRNELASTLAFQTLLSMCQVTEEVMRATFLVGRTNLTFRPLVDAMAAASAGTVDTSGFTQWKSDVDANFDLSIESMLDGTYTLGAATTPSTISADFAIAYACRNLAAHRIQHHPVVSERFDDILPRILCAIFFLTEKFYP